MTTRRGVCVNHPHCRLADTAQVQEVQADADMACQACGSALVPENVGWVDSGRYRRGVLIGIVAFVGLALFSFALAPGRSPTAGKAIAATQATSAPAVAPAPSRSTAAKPEVRPELLLRLAGSTTIGTRLAPLLAEAYLASLGATGVQVVAGQDDVAVQGSKDGTRLFITVAASGSSFAFEALGSGAADIGMSSRHIKADEAQSLQALGAMSSSANEHVLAVDGIAVVVSRANPISELNREQLASVFSGTVTDWSALSSTSGPIHVYARGERSGTMSTFQTLVLGSTRVSPEAKRLPTSEAVLEAVMSDPNGIGFVSLPFTSGAKVVAVAEEDGTMKIPTAFALATEDYFLARRLYLYTPRVSKNPHVTRFIDFALGPGGQAIVKKAGFIELTVKAELSNAPAGAPEQYTNLIAGTRRLSTNFRFLISSSDLDNRALRDLERVVEYLRDNDLNGASVKLLGFADNRGDAADNVALSRSRAHHVAAALARRGITGVAIAGFGSAMPVATNGSPEGRERNRRVEIWISR